MCSHDRISDGNGPEKGVVRGKLTVLEKAALLQTNVLCLPEGNVWIGIQTYTRQPPHQAVSLKLQYPMGRD